MEAQSEKQTPKDSISLTDEVTDDPNEQLESHHHGRVTQADNRQAVDSLQTQPNQQHLLPSFPLKQKYPFVFALVKIARAECGYALSNFPAATFYILFDLLSAALSHNYLVLTKYAFGAVIWTISLVIRSMRRVP